MKKIKNGLNSKAKMIAKITRNNRERKRLLKKYLKSKENCLLIPKVCDIINT